MDHPSPPGVVQHLEPGLRMMLAPNPSPMTHWGTNTYLLGAGEVTVIDPGPADDRHLAALLAALEPGERITQILVTHAHLDHSPLARPLARATGAEILAFGGATSGRSPRMVALAGLGGGEGLDHTFQPDRLLRDGDQILGADWALTTLHTPGHLGGHLCFAWGETLFCGDHVMGWAPSLVSPPDGDMTDYMASLDRIAQGGWRRGYSAHGAPLPDLPARIAEITAHRRSREAAILAALTDSPDLTTLQHRVYAELAPALQPAARRNLLAHLVDLAHRKKIVPDTEDWQITRFHRI